MGLAYSFEQATLVRRPPATTPSLPGEEFEFEAVAETVPEPGTVPTLTLLGLGAFGVKTTRRCRNKRH